MENMESKGLPEAFVLKMKALLGEEAESFLKSYEETRRFGLRINPLRRSELSEAFMADTEASRADASGLMRLARIPWTEEGYYYEENMRPGKHPLHEAGLYYIQEPSAMAVCEALKPRPGERILDLCAAPGGKSTHIAGKMAQDGILVCNEIHPARAKILSRNIERMGIANAVVLNMEPKALAAEWGGFFDGIVVDAPCSGEGMFRKDEDARTEWSPEHVKMCAVRQDGILDCAARMLRDGGRLVYSTCTFSPEENEQTIARFLERHPSFVLARPDCACFFETGRPEWASGNEELKKTMRIWPHKTGGEGHFVAFLIKGAKEDTGELCSLSREKEQNRLDADGRHGKRQGRKQGKPRAGQREAAVSGRQEFTEFCEENLNDPRRLTDKRHLVSFGDQLYLAPDAIPCLDGLKILRPGLHVGTSRKGRLVPSHALALFLKKEEARRTEEIGTGEMAEKYMRGEMLCIPGVEKGWTLITSGGCSLGWGKSSGDMLKNYYPKGLRKG